MQFLGLLRQDIIRDVMFLFNPESGLFHALIAMGSDVCGHPCTVHGGFTSAVIDETTGKQLAQAAILQISPLSGVNEQKRLAWFVWCRVMGSKRIAGTLQIAAHMLYPLLPVIVQP